MNDRRRAILWCGPVLLGLTLAAGTAEGSILGPDGEILGPCGGGYVTTASQRAAMARAEGWLAPSLGVFGGLAVALLAIPADRRRRRQTGRDPRRLGWLVVMLAAVGAGGVLVAGSVGWFLLPEAPVLP